jgi:hypothetical protein
MGMIDLRQLGICLKIRIARKSRADVGNFWSESGSPR